jgi:hypothetical protein
MSSALAVNMNATNGMLGGAVGKKAVDEKPHANAGLSPRQTALTRLWSYYRCENYGKRKVDWDGQTAMDPEQTEFVAQSGFLPGGYYDAGATLPVNFRRPSVPFYLGKVVVDRFTSLLFSNRRHPSITVSDDPISEDWLVAVVEQSRLWAMMLVARCYGGAMGAVGIGFKFIKGKCVIEIHDPRWSTPTFLDRESLEVDKIEKRYIFTDWTRNDEGHWVEGKFWYRRVIDDEKDTVWPKVPCKDNQEPDWKMARRTEVYHNFAFCPVVWCQNKPVEGSVDGDPDCQGAFDLIERCDQLRSQANKAVMANCDPTLNVNTDADLDNVVTGSSGALKLEKGGNASYLEITGTGPTAAMEMADKLEEKILLLVRCFLDTNTGGPSRTMSEVEHNYSSMIEQADVFREQYGEKGVKKLLELILEAGREMEKPTVEKRDSDGLPTIIKRTVRLPAKVIIDEATNTTLRIPRRPGKGEQIELKWPPYFQPTLDDTGKAVTAAGQAKTFGLIDLEHSVRFVASHFQVEDVKALLAKLAKETTTADKSLQDQMMARMTNPHAMGDPKPGQPAAPALPAASPAMPSPFGR